MEKKILRKATSDPAFHLLGALFFISVVITGVVAAVLVLNLPFTQEVTEVRLGAYEQQVMVVNNIANARPGVLFYMAILGFVVLFGKGSIKMYQRRHRTSLD